MVILALDYCRDFLAGPSWPQGARTCPPWPAWAAAFARVGQGGRFSPKPGPQIIFFERAKAQTRSKAGKATNAARRGKQNSLYVALQALQAVLLAQADHL